MRRSVAAAIVAVLVCGSGSAQSPARPRPLVLPAPAYQCLVQHVDTVKIGKRGAYVDLGGCPPTVIKGFTDERMEEQVVFLTPDDLACIRRARQRQGRLAFRRPGDRVALYLAPCQRR